ncbi:MAG: hypothetical protein FD169_1849 [Bacillota bacterium]|nr:MAG: hypothetical protein FD169_1849 [Bacillota bacterium]
MIDNVKKPIYKRTWFIVVCALTVLGLIGSALNNDSPSERVDGDIAGTQQEAPSSAVVQPKPQEVKIVSPSDVKWNMTDVSTDTNGNLLKASTVLNKMTQADFDREEIYEIPASQVHKTPWEYYGQTLKMTGEVWAIEVFPPGGDVSKAIANGGKCAELRILDETETVFIDFIYIGDIGDISVDDVVTIVGLPIGRDGLTGTSLVIVGK